MLEKDENKHFLLVSQILFTFLSVCECFSMCDTFMSICTSVLLQIGTNWFYRLVILYFSRILALFFSIYFTFFFCLLRNSFSTWKFSSWFKLLKHILIPFKTYSMPRTFFLFSNLYRANFSLESGIQISKKCLSTFKHISDLQ